MAQIKAEQRLLAVKRRLAIFSIGLFGSGLVFISTFQMAQAEISN